MLQSLREKGKRAAGGLNVGKMTAPGVCVCKREVYLTDNGYWMNSK